MGWTVYNSDGQILQGSSTLADDAVTTAKILDDAVTYAKMQNLATADRVLGSTSTGLIGEVQVVPDMIASDAVTTVKIIDDAVTYVKMQNLATADRVLGSTSTGVIGEVQIVADMIATDAITTVKIANDQVTGAKLNPSLVLGDIIYADGTDTIARLAKGSATEVLTMGGSNAPTWAAAGSGDLVLIGTVEAASDGQVAITGLDTSVYDYFDIGFAGFTPEDDNVGLYIRLGDSGGNDVGASDYAWCRVRSDENGSRSAEADTSDSKIELCTGIGNASTEGYSGILTMNTGDLTMNTTIHGPGVGIIQNDTVSYFLSYAMRHTNLTLTQIIVGFTAGEIATGRLTVWGRKHA